jgi:hypothetical protein
MLAAINGTKAMAIENWLAFIDVAAFCRDNPCVVVDYILSAFWYSQNDADHEPCEPMSPLNFIRSEIWLSYIFCNVDLRHMVPRALFDFPSNYAHDSHLIGDRPEQRSRYIHALNVPNLCIRCGQTRLSEDLAVRLSNSKWVS